MFGGLGVGIDHPNVILEAELSESLLISGQEAEIASILAEKFFFAYQTKTNVQLTIKQAIPAHVGLGSGTQLALAIAKALALLFNVRASTQELAVAMGRARRTGVGTAIFEKGGFVLDGGKNTNNASAQFPPLIYRQPFPKEWRFVVAVPNLKKGLANTEETEAFNRMPKMPEREVGKICRLTMMKLLPALAEKDIESFGEALTKIQALTGNHFGQAQGTTYSSPEASDCIEFMRKAGAYGVGQSSWGPTIYSVVKEEEAKQMLSKVKAYLNRGVGGQVFIVRANNKGATVKITS